MTPKTYTIDASGKVLGRLAVDVALILRGKDKPGYLPYKDENIVVEIKNIDKVKISGKKLEKKIYYHYTGYPGGLRKIPMKKIFGENPGEILKKAVWGMLPANKLRNRQIRRLKVV